MTPVKTLLIYGNILDILTLKTRFSDKLKKVTNIHAPVLLNVLNSLQKRDKMLGKPCILSFSQTCLVNLITLTGLCMILYEKSGVAYSITADSSYISVPL